MRTLAITKAEYLDEYRLTIYFSDRTEQVIDFKSFLFEHFHPAHDKYRQLSNFKQFRIERGNVVWGEDWDLIFPVSQLHKGCIAPVIY